jgi:hypothetical protein
LTDSDGATAAAAAVMPPNKLPLAPAASV